MWMVKASKVVVVKLKQLKDAGATAESGDNSVGLSPSETPLTLPVVI